MAENPPPSIGIDPEIQDDESTLGSLRSTVVTTPKILVSFTIR